MRSYSSRASYSLGLSTIEFRSKSNGPVPAPTLHRRTPNASCINAILKDLLSLSMRPVVDQTNEVPHENHNRDLANGRYVDRRLFFDVVGEVLSLSETVDKIRNNV